MTTNIYSSEEMFFVLSSIANNIIVTILFW